MDKVFSTIVYELARQLGAAVLAIHRPSITPNFWAAELQRNGARFYVLCSDEGNWAFSRFFAPRECRLEFEDIPDAAELLQQLFGKTPLSKAELDAPLQTQPSTRARDLRYWKPATQGELLFNWWD